MISILHFSASLGAGLTATLTQSFREFVSGTIAGMESVGLVNTYASGTINTGTVLPPVTTNQSRGYAVFSFNDTLQSTSPVFIRVEFGMGSATTNASLWFTVGTDHNMSGTLINSSSRRQVNMLTGVVPSLPQYFSGDMVKNGRFAMLLNNTNPSASVNSAGGVFMIQRTRDINGNDTPTGIMWYSTARITDIVYSSYIMNSSTQPFAIAEGTSWIALAPGSGDVIFSGRASSTMSFVPLYPPKSQFPAEDLLIGPAPSFFFRSQEIIQVQLGNRTVPYLVYGNELNIGPQSPNQNRVFMRFE